MTESGFHRQLATTSLVVGPKRNSKALPRARLALKKVVGTVWWSAAGLMLCSCLKPLHLRSVLSKLLRCAGQKLQHPQPMLVTRKGPVLHDNAWPRTGASKVEQMGYEVLPHLPYSTSCQSTTTSSSILTTFCRENASTTSRRQKMLSKSSSNPEAQIFYTTGMNQLISWWQKRIDCHGSYFVY